MKKLGSSIFFVAIIVFLGICVAAITLTVVQVRKRRAISDPPEISINSLPRVQGVAPRSTFIAEKTFCHDSPSFWVVECWRSGEVGNHFLVKSKGSRDQVIPCKYLVEEGDFEVPHEADKFLDLKNDYLFLDGGTGPYRKLSIWDLKNQINVFSSGFTDLEMGSTSLTFWNYSGMANESNCPEKKEWEAAGLTALVETRYRLSLSDFTVLPSSETRCAQGQ